MPERLRPGSMQQVMHRCKTFVFSIRFPSGDGFSIQIPQTSVIRELAQSIQSVIIPASSCPNRAAWLAILSAGDNRCPGACAFAVFRHGPRSAQNGALRTILKAKA